MRPHVSSDGGGQGVVYNLFGVVGIGGVTCDLSNHGGTIRIVQIR